MSSGKLSEIQLANVERGEGSVFPVLAEDIREMYRIKKDFQKNASERINIARKESGLSFEVFSAVFMEQFDPEEKHIANAALSLFS